MTINKWTNRYTFSWKLIHGKRDFSFRSNILFGIVYLDLERERCDKCIRIEISILADLSFLSSLYSCIESVNATQILISQSLNLVYVRYFILLSAMSNLWILCQSASFSVVVVSASVVVLSLQRHSMPYTWLGHSFRCSTKRKIITKGNKTHLPGKKSVFSISNTYLDRKQNRAHTKHKYSYLGCMQITSCTRICTHTKAARKIQKWWKATEREKNIQRYNESEPDWERQRY